MDRVIPGTLTLVGTPIGNLSDLSPRALEALQTCDFIAAEDTRVTLKLLNHFGIVKPLISYFEHNKRERGQVICDRLLRGERGVLVTDAGMPAISDPGEELVAQCHEQGIPVGVVPGPTAMATALAVSWDATLITLAVELPVSSPGSRVPRMVPGSAMSQKIFLGRPHLFSSSSAYVRV